MTTHTTLLSCVTWYNLITFRWYKYNNITVSSQISFGEWMGYKNSFEDGLHSMRSFLSFPPPPPSPPFCSPPAPSPLCPPISVFLFAHTHPLLLLFAYPPSHPFCSPSHPSPPFLLTTSPSPYFFLTPGALCCSLSCFMSLPWKWEGNVCYAGYFKRRW